MDVKVLGKNINDEEACKLRIPTGWKLLELKDLPEVMNNAEKYGIKRGEYYFFKQYERRFEKDYPLTSLPRSPYPKQ